jgi:hypothetical protein
MLRIGVYVTEKQAKSLKREAARTGLRQSELIRRAIDQFLKGLQKP